MRVQGLLKQKSDIGDSQSAIPDANERERCIQEFLPFIKYQVLRLTGRIPSHVEIGDLTHAGIVGLLDALEKYDPSKGTKLRTYAEFRIRGAILDQLRSMDWASRATRSKVKLLDRALVSLETKLQRPPTEEEVAEHLGIDMDDYHQMVLEARGGGPMPIEELLHTEVADCWVDAATGSDPHESFILKEIRSRVREALEMLSDKERMVMQLYYYEELTMKEIGMVLGLSESRVCQIHSGALAKLKSCIKV